MKNIGSRAEVFHGNAKKTKGNLKKEDLMLNKYGNIVSKKQSKRMMGKNNPLENLAIFRILIQENSDPVVKLIKKLKKLAKFISFLNS